jgi:hypothetical protein
LVHLVAAHELAEVNIIKLSFLVIAAAANKLERLLLKVFPSSFAFAI